MSCGSAVTIGDAPPGLHDTGAYRAGRPRLHRVAGPALRAFDHRRLALLGTLAAPPARLLDAGAGRGRFVAAARAAGYDASGIEPSWRGSGEAGSGLGATVPLGGGGGSPGGGGGSPGGGGGSPGGGAGSPGGAGAVVQGVSIERAQIPAGSLNAVTLWHVLEHLDDPAGALERLRTWLAPGGALLVGVPNLASVQASIGGGRWYHLDVPRHRVHYTPAGVHALLAAHGFVVLSTHHLLLEHNPFGMWQSLVNRVTRDPSYLYNLLKRNAPLRSWDLVITALALPLAPLAAVGELGAGVAGRGGTIAVLARRR